MNENLTCPVCGSAVDESGGLRCKACGFETAFVRYFASPESASFWRSEAERRAVPPIAAAQARLEGRLFFGGNTVNTVGICLDDACYTVNGIYGTSADSAVVQVGIGARHRVFLRRDGTVAAEGSNDFCECDVSSLRDVCQVVAANGRTIALRKDGTVQETSGLFKGLMKRADFSVLEGFTGITRLAYGGEHLAGVTSDGHLLIRTDYARPSRPSEVDEFLNAQASLLRGVKAVAAGSDLCTLVLLEDGTVRFIGKADDPRSAVSGWRNVTAVAVDTFYSVGLTADGHILLVGKASSPMLDAGRAEAADWENVAAVVCSQSVIAGVTSYGQLLLAGNVPRRAELQSAWEKDVRPAVNRGMRI